MEKFHDHEEENQDPSVRIELGNGQEFECTPDNTDVYLFKEREYDCIIHENVEDGETIGHCMFRGNVPEFDEVVDYMRIYEYPMSLHDEVPDMIKTLYNQVQGRLQRVEATVKEYDPEHHLTPRQERTVAYLGHLLVNEHIAPHDFENDVDAII